MEALQLDVQEGSLDFFSILHTSSFSQEIQYNFSQYTQYTGHRHLVLRKSNASESSL